MIHGLDTVPGIAQMLQFLGGDFGIGVYLIGNQVKIYINYSPKVQLCFNKFSIYILPLPGFYKIFIFILAYIILASLSVNMPLIKSQTV